jgi:3-isopropylmalate/(R)-2-methylmalate dehydratase small subunit
VSTQRISALSFSVPVDNIDTDQIIPARFLTTTDRDGLGACCFHDWRYCSDGSAKDGHAFHHHDPDHHHVLVAGHNFGCGSSREHAPWALLDMGFKAVISTRFADIFCNNALKNGLLPVAAPQEVVDFLHQHPNHPVHIDIANLTLEVPECGTYTFPCDPFAAYCLVRGIDPLQFIMDQQAEITRYEQRYVS